MNATIWHNPGCSKSRATLALLEQAGMRVEIIDYLRTPPTRDTLAALYAAAGISACAGLRMSEPAASTLMGESDEVILAAMTADPVLIERPLVRTARGVRLCRPPERVLELL